jgi:hypothetical protein
MEDQPVCHYGITTGQSCGIGQDIHYDPGPTYCNGGPCDDVWVLIEGQYLECDFGDSGGPVFLSGSAWGILSGGFPNCAYIFIMSAGALQWDGVNTRIKLGT